MLSLSPQRPLASMHPQPAFGVQDTHRIPHKFHAKIHGSSEGLGWISAFASIQRERPYTGKLQALSDSLMVLHRGGPVDVTYTVKGKPVSRHIPKGGVFFLPAGQECDVALHAALDTTHIYLRSNLFTDEKYPAMGDAIVEGLRASSLFVDPLAKAIANRFIAINYHKPATEAGKHLYRLTNRQLRRLCDFVDANLHTNIRLNAMAGTSGLSTEYFARVFKGTMGVSAYQYVLGLRVERAKALLCDDGQSLADIAAQCGFSHQEHMSRVFRRFTGLTPSRYKSGC
jgi:AraC family transcriptional regulator